MPPQPRDRPRLQTGLRTGATLVFATLTLGCSDNKLGVVRNPPSVTITAPTPGSQFYEGQNIEFEALVEPYDSDEDVTTISHRWVTGNETMCEDDAFGSDNYGYCDFTFSVVGLKTVQVTVTDQRGDRSQAEVEVEVIDNTPPDIEIIDPEDGIWVANDELLVIEALVSDLEEDPQNLGVVLESNLDGVLNEAATPDSSGSYQGPVTIPTPGQHLITARAEDSYGQSAQDAITVNVYEHGPPSADSVRITPNPAVTTDTLYAEVQGWEDLDGFDEAYRFEWYITYVDDTGGGEFLDTSETTEEYPSGKTEKGDLIRVMAYPFNDYGEGDPLSSTTLEISNSPPTAPGVSISPTAPEPEDDLRCQVDTASFDDDGDFVTYAYAWYRNGSLTPDITNVLDASLTANGDVWECVVTPNDGEDNGTAASATVSIVDVTPPDPPVFDTPVRYTNDETVGLEGDCEAGCTLTIYCSDASTSWTEVQTCAADDTFSYTDTFTRGDTTSCYAECEDASGNLSNQSSTVTFEVCDPEDTYEDSAGYGDSGANAVTGFSTLTDDGSSTISIEGNVLGGDSVDWYTVSTSDDVAADRSAGIDYYRFQVQFLDGSATYEMSVYKGGYSSGDEECSTSSGITEYADYVEDDGYYEDDSTRHDHTIPSDTRSCGNSSNATNNCEDMSNTYYIKVERRSSTVSSCQGYELEITNGVW